MREHDWTADEVWNLVKGWPDEAKPAGLDQMSGFWWAEKDSDWTAKGSDPISPALAAALHIASGLEWLAGQHNWPTEVVHPSKNDAENMWFVGWPTTYADAMSGTTTVKGKGTTLLHAISTAIAAIT